MKQLDPKAPISAFFVIALLMGGCRKEEPTQGESVKKGEARSVFVRNHSGIPMRFEVEINGLPYEIIDLENDETLIFYEPLPIGLPREQVESYRIEGKLTDNFGRSTEGNDLEFSLDVGKSEAYPYHPTGWRNSTLNPSYRFTEPLDEWLDEINADVRKIEDFEMIHVVASPIEETRNQGGEPVAVRQ